MNTKIAKEHGLTRLKVATITFVMILMMGCAVAVHPSAAYAEDIDNTLDNPVVVETVEEETPKQESLQTEEQVVPQTDSDTQSGDVVDGVTEATPAVDVTAETTTESTLDESANQDDTGNQTTTDDQGSAEPADDTNETDAPSSVEEPSADEPKADETEVAEPTTTPSTDNAEVIPEQANSAAAPKIDEDAQADELASQITSMVTMATSSTSTVSKFVIVLDPGHGGDDSGAVGNGLREKDLTLSIAKYAKAQLDKLSGVVVYLTRDGDYKLGDTEHDDIVNRIQFAVSHHADVFVSIHINAGGGTGFEVWVQNDSAYRNSLHDEGVALANRIANKESALGLNAHGTAVKTRNSTSSYPSPGGYEDYYGILRYSRYEGLPALIVENLFIDNASDASWLKSDTNRNKLGVAIANAIIEQYDLHQNLVRDEKGVRYIEDGTNTYVKNAWKTVGNDTYYFGSDGYAVKYSQDLIGTDGKQHRYYFNGAGVMQTGFVTWKQDGTKSFFAQNSKYIPIGAAFTKWVITGGKTYYFNPSTYRCVRYSNTLTGKDGKQHRYYFNGAGVMQTGWVTFKQDGTKSYYDPANGAALAGWQDISGKTYYFRMSDCRTVRYAQKLTGKDGNQHDYYFNGLGEMFTGLLTWSKDKTKSYYDPSTGAAVTGWKDIAKKTYYFNPTTLRAVRYAQKLTGKDGKQHDYYFNGLSEMFTGLLTWSKDKTKSYYDPSTGAAVTKWRDISGKTYYFHPTTLRAVRYAQKLTGRDGSQHNYYFSGAGIMQVGWITWAKDGTKSYYEPDKTLGTYGARYTGNHSIGGVVYTFDDEGVCRGEVTQGENIMGVTLTTVAQMVKHYTNTVGSAAYPSSVYKSKGAATIEAFCTILLEEANAEGVRAEVVYSQTMLETNYLRFGGLVSVDKCNFAGIGATGAVNPTTGKIEDGNRFESVREGLRAQVQHLKAYASTKPLNNACVDPRFNLVKRGCAPTISALSGEWAVSSAYGNSLKQILSALMQTK